MLTHIRRGCVISYMILTFKVIKGDFRSNKFLWQVPSGVSSVGYLLSKRHSIRNFKFLYHLLARGTQ